MKKIGTVLSCLLVTFITSSQDFSDQFNQFKRDKEKAFDQTVRRQDSVFSTFISQNWTKFQLQQPLEEPVSEPKPLKQPEIKESPQRIDHGIQPVRPMKKMRSFSPSGYAEDETAGALMETARFGFYGKDVAIKYHPNFIQTNSFVDLDERAADFYQKLSYANYQKTVNQLTSIKSELGLPDYGYYLLVSEFITQTIGNEEVHPFFQWFILLKSGFDVKVGFSVERPILLLGVNGEVYNRSYFRENELYYYAEDLIPGSIASYEGRFDDELVPIEFSIVDQMDLPLDAKKRVVKLEMDGETLELDFWYNQNTVNFLGEFPQVELSYYFNSTGSLMTHKTLEKSIIPLLEGKTPTQQVEQLMQLIQKGFAYEVDKNQFGKEKVMYPDEFLAYEFSDCDDRSVFLSFLIRKFTDLGVLGITFPQHVALGVRLPPPIYGENFQYQGYTFTICDPTYYNAPVGTVIPAADRSKMKVVEMK